MGERKTSPPPFPPSPSPSPLSPPPYGICMRCATSTPPLYQHNVTPTDPRHHSVVASSSPLVHANGFFACTWGEGGARGARDVTTMLPLCHLRVTIVSPPCRNHVTHHCTGRRFPRTHVGRRQPDAAAAPRVFRFARATRGGARGLFLPPHPHAQARRHGVGATVTLPRCQHGITTRSPRHGVSTASPPGHHATLSALHHHQVTTESSLGRHQVTLRSSPCIITKLDHH